MTEKKRLKSIEVIVNDDVLHKKRWVFLRYDAIKSYEF